DQDAARARELHSQLRESRQSIRSQIESTLTPEQRTQLEQFQTQQKVRREEMSNRRLRRKNHIQQQSQRRQLQYNPHNGSDVKADDCCGLARSRSRLRRRN